MFDLPTGFNQRMLENMGVAFVMSLSLLKVPDPRFWFTTILATTGAGHHKLWADSHVPCWVGASHILACVDLQYVCQMGIGFGGVHTVLGLESVPVSRTWAGQLWDSEIRTRWLNLGYQWSWVKQTGLSHSGSWSLVCLLCRWLSKRNELNSLFPSYSYTI